MAKYFFRNLSYLVLLAGILIKSCNGQVNPNPTMIVTDVPKPVPEIVGTPTPESPAHNPYNDTGLLSQYIQSIFQDSKGNFWFGPAGQNVARYDVKTLRYFSKNEFFQGNESVDRDDGNSVHAITKLVQDQRLSLDKTLADYFSELVGRIEYADQITLRMMVRHRSGIPNFTDTPNYWMKPAGSKEEALNLVLKQLQ